MIVMYDIVVSKKCAFIDEIEKGIHSKALNFILRMFVMLSKESQLIIATQDLQLTDMADLRRDTVRWIKKDSAGRSYIDKINQNKVHKNKNLRNYLYQEMLGDMNDFLEDGQTFDNYIRILYHTKNTHITD